MNNESILGLIVLIIYLLILVGFVIGLFVYVDKISNMQSYCRIHCYHYYWFDSDNIRDNVYYYQYCVYLKSLSYKDLVKEYEYLKDLTFNETIKCNKEN